MRIAIALAVAALLAPAEVRAQAADAEKLAAAQSIFGIDLQALKC